MKTKTKNKKTWIFLGIVAVVVIVLIIVAVTVGGGAAPKTPVTVVDAEAQDIKQVIDISGVVASEESKTYFAQVSAKINELNVENGGDVTKGSNLVTYDTEMIEDNLKLKQLEAKQSKYGADAVTIGLDSAQKKASDAAVNYNDAVKFVQHYTDCANQLKSQINEATSLKEQIAALDAEIAALQAELKERPDSVKIPGKIKEKTKESKSLQKQLDNYNLTDLQNAYEKCTSDLADYKALEAEYKATKETADPTASVQKAQQGVVRELAQLSEQDVMEELAKAKEGVKAEVNGIVSDLKVVAGQTVQAGEPLFTIADSDKIKVTVELTKYNLENISLGQKAELTINGKQYTGEVSYINKVAQTNQAGATVVQADIHIDNADSNIFLGVEAQVTISVAEKKDALVVPLACVNYGADSTFCYVVEDGSIVKKDVETGITSMEYIEITSGLSEGQQIINAMGVEYEEGTAVTPMYE